METSKKIILGIETSCDDTSICILKGNPDDLSIRPEILSHLSFSQEKFLRRWGGVVPEIASRNHLAKLVPLLQESFKEADISPEQIDLIGVTTHPGLLGPLLTGLNAAKSLALYHQTPIISVNHLYSHLEAVHIDNDISYPYLGLLVSGGHSLYLLVQSKDQFDILGSTIDDAAGEAFDKGAKLMGLGYPGGRIIDDLAKEGDSTRFSFPIGLIGSKTAELSFSGTKTSLRTFTETNTNFKEFLPDLCASYQKSIVDALARKMIFALKKADKGDIPIVVGGGVACNSALRKKLNDDFPNVTFVTPKFCTDNGAMIANYALRNYSKAIPFPNCLKLDARGRFIDKAKQQEAR